MTRALVKIRSLVAVVIAVGLVVAGCSSSSEDPAAVVADYLEVWNAEDAEAVIVFYTDDAVLVGLPNDSDGLTTGTSEILAMETRLDGLQGSTGTMEYLNMVVSGDTVTFDNIFINGSGSCFSSTGSVMTVENGKIAGIIWGNPEGGLC